MSKGGSGLFSGTNATTATVWNNITETQPKVAGTKIPKSFNISTVHGDFWVHSNGTKHIIQEIMSTKTKHPLKQSNPNLYSQFLLHDYHSAVNKIPQGTISFGSKIKSGNWEFIFVKPRSDGKNIVIKHAQFNGWKE